MNSQLRKFRYNLFSKQIFDVSTKKLSQEHYEIVSE